MQRLHHELSVIERMGFSHYFLVVWDFVRFARSHELRWDPVADRRLAA